MADRPPDKSPGSRAGWLSWRRLRWVAFALVAAFAVWWGGLFVFMMAFGFNDAPGDWAMIIYPDKTDRTRFVITPRFQSFSTCRYNALEEMTAREIEATGDWECGRNCPLDGDPHKANQCEEVRK